MDPLSTKPGNVRVSNSHLPSPSGGGNNGTLQGHTITAVPAGSIAPLPVPIPVPVPVPPHGQPQQQDLDPLVPNAGFINSSQYDAVVQRLNTAVQVKPCFFGRGRSHIDRLRSPTLRRVTVLVVMCRFLRACRRGNQQRRANAHPDLCQVAHGLLTHSIGTQGRTI